MNIIGLHFGHDGAVCVISDGKIRSYVLRERFSRVKHAVMITQSDLNRALADANLSMADIDCFAITSTQECPVVTGFLDDFFLSFDPHPFHGPIPSPCVAELGPIADRLHKQKALMQDLLMPAEQELIRQGRVRGITGSLDQFCTLDEWNRTRTLREISEANRSHILNSQQVLFGFHYPVTVHCQGLKKPGYWVHHHMAHAASCFYRSGFAESVIVTHDGAAVQQGRPYDTGMIYYGTGHRIIALQPHYLALGNIYEETGVRCFGFRLGSASGKVMGLAPYGRPVFYHPDFVGNWYDYYNRFGSSYPPVQWVKHCLSMAQETGYPMELLAQQAHITERVNADIAASTQKIFEESFFATVQAAYRMCVRSGIRTENLCLGGGTALNCPSNTQLHNASSFSSLFIDPSCGDDGLAIGSALYIHHQLLGYRLDTGYWQGQKRALPYVGRVYRDDEMGAALEAAQDQVFFERLEDSALTAARELAEQNHIIAWFEGGSESGPRALGHRSILANPMHAENWKKVNLAKGREWWRPFAPAVLEEDAGEWFHGGPDPSPYMLFTAQVRSSRLPAITHIDGTARIQTVTQDCGRYYQLIKAFKELTAIPVLLNTSFNGPGEPIVETPEHAIRFLCASKIDALFMGRYRVCRKDAALTSTQLS
ncbi:MAG: hypothetical protein HQL58_08450 [Magnetococcales bacterium]|nr:hypothetical protein [Magnetococcales bacterium]